MVAVRRVVLVVLGLAITIGALAASGRGYSSHLAVAAVPQSNGYSYDHAHTPSAGVVSGAVESAVHPGTSGAATKRGHDGRRYDDTRNLARASARPDGHASAPQATRPLFSQTTASPMFRHGPFAGQTIGDVAGGLRAGKIHPGDLPVDVMVRNGETIGLNTRSMLALRRGGIDPADWILNDVTGVPGMERLLTERLLRNQLTGGTDVLRITGAGRNASNLL